MARMKQTPRAKVIRRALGLSQEEFAARYQVPIGTLRDWEQGRTEPDRAAKAYLKVIASEPDTVADERRTLRRMSSGTRRTPALAGAAVPQLSGQLQLCTFYIMSVIAQLIAP